MNEQEREMYMNGRKPLNEQATDQQAIHGGSGMNASRESARRLLERRIRESEQRTANLQALYMALPLELSPLADEALWQMLVGMK